MVELQAVTNDGGGAVLSETAVEDFRASLGGQLMFPGESEYD
jgi:hypothetical protein